MDNLSDDLPNTVTDSYQLPITIKPYAAALVASFYQLVAFLAFGLFFILAFHKMYLVLPLAAAFVVICVFSWARLLQQRLNLGVSSFEYQQASGTQTIAYNTIEKVGYHMIAAGGRGGTRIRYWIELFVAGQPKPVQIPLGIFTKKDIFTLLHIIVQKNPDVLIGDNVATALTTGIFPKKTRLFAFPAVIIQDTHFAAAQPQLFIPPETADKGHGVYIVLGFLRLVVVLAALYFFMQMNVLFFLACLGVILVLQLIGAAITHGGKYL